MSFSCNFSFEDYLILLCRYFIKLSNPVFIHIDMIQRKMKGKEIQIEKKLIRM